MGVGKSALFEQLYKGAPHPRKVSGCKVELSEALLAKDRKGRPLSSWSKVFRPGAKEIDVEAAFSPGPEMSHSNGSATVTLVDTPGAALLFARGEDECATRDFLMAGEADVLVVVADAKNLRRSLVLFLQATEFQLPTVLVMNMMDEAQQLGLEFDLERLAVALTVELSPVVAIEGHILERLTALFERANIPSIRVPYPKEVEMVLETLAELLSRAPISPRALGLLLLAGDRRAEQMLEEEIDPQVANRAREVVRKAKETFHHP
ncbi:MAG: 50S ribosome-binding GTPase, partial [Deltaproteobacteria bacterium]|nr:50S ribosome-binding GTPase [Deltaproteobacteria bacterium]